jgi:uncharacterized protein (DUF1501 family)
MKRRDFLKLTGPLSLAPFTLNGMAIKGVNDLFKFNEILTTENFKGRHVVIIQMRGANDGLNTVIPYNQYDGYASNRPTIRLPESVLVTELDASLPDEKRGYLNPSMTGGGSIQSLYDEGKVNIIHGIGYPTPNYSHFRSTDLLLGGKDGDYQPAVKQGWFADYLATVYPGFAGQPTQGLPHPLGIQIGDNSQNMGYRHESLHNVGVNVTATAEKTFYNNLRSADENHYQELLTYVESIDSAADTYNQVIESTFNNGSNNITYPDTYLANQLQTLAKLLSGGLKSKLLLADMNGFDTHVSQVSGSGTDTLTGRHADLLKELSDAVYAFQKDLEAQGLADEVVVVTMSEFGRKIKENASNGTDHGDLSNWMVIGNGVTGGVTGRNIDLSDGMVNTAGRTEDVMQHDYRRLLTSVMQDWLGSSDTVLSGIETDDAAATFITHAGANKLDVFKSNYKVSSANQISAFSGLSIITRELTFHSTVGGWTYYGDPNDSNSIFFGIEHNPTGGNTATFTPSITVTNLIDDGAGIDYYSATNNTEANFTLGDYWNIDLNDDVLDGFVNIRFFVESTRITALENEANAYKTSQSSLYLSTNLWVQTQDPDFFDPQNQVKDEGFSVGIIPLGTATSGTYSSKEYYQFNTITELGNNGGGMMIKITSNNNGITPEGRPAINPEPGTLMFNSTTGNFEGWNGASWVTLNNI